MIRGDKGDKGDKGDRGDKGDKGDKGQSDELISRMVSPRRKGTNETEHGPCHLGQPCQPYGNPASDKSRALQDDKRI